MADRRYTYYTINDVMLQSVQMESQLQYELVDGTLYGNSITLRRAGVEYRAVWLLRSSDWYRHSFNFASGRWHGISCVVCGTHDSCLEHVPVLAVDARRWYEPMEMRVKSLAPVTVNDQGRASDSFERLRKTHYGHNMLLGALMCGRDDAFARLKTLPSRTRRRIEAEVKLLHYRRPGRPLKIAPVYPLPGETHHA